MTRFQRKNVSHSSQFHFPGQLWVTRAKTSSIEQNLPGQSQPGDIFAKFRVRYMRVTLTSEDNTWQ